MSTILALSSMDPTVQGILFLVAVIFFLIAAYIARNELGWLVPAGLAFATFVFMWQAFAAS